MYPLVRERGSGALLLYTSMIESTVNPVLPVAVVGETYSERTMRSRSVELTDECLFLACFAMRAAQEQ